MPFTSRVAHKFQFQWISIYFKLRFLDLFFCWHNNNKYNNKNAIYINHLWKSVRYLRWHSSHMRIRCHTHIRQSARAKGAKSCKRKHSTKKETATSLHTHTDHIAHMQNKLFIRYKSIFSYSRACFRCVYSMLGDVQILLTLESKVMESHKSVANAKRSSASRQCSRWEQQKKNKKHFLLLAISTTAQRRSRHIILIVRLHMCQSKMQTRTRIDSSLCFFFLYDKCI